MLHLEVSRLWSKGLIAVYTDSKARYDPETNALVKFGKNLRVGDIVVAEFDDEPSGRWKVVALEYAESLGLSELRVGGEYGVWIRQEKAVLPFRLVRVDLDSKVYKFESLSSRATGFDVDVQHLPSVYPLGTKVTAHAGATEAVLRSMETGCERRLNMTQARAEKFTIDVGASHVVEAIGYVRRESDEDLTCG